jgi:NCS2 family nucleobase:cation symporter-2
MAAIDRTLRRLLRKDGVRPTVTAALERAGQGHAITDIDGNVLLGDPGATSETTAPITAGARDVGQAFGPEAASLGELVSALAALDDETRAVAGESLQRYRELTMLYDVSERIISAPDPVSVATTVTEEAERFLACDSVCVLLRNPETDLLEVLANRGSPFHARGSLPIGDDVVASVLHSGLGEIVNDLTIDARGLDAENALRSIVCSPLRSKDLVLGVVVAGTEGERHFNASDLDVLNSMAAQAGTAIQVTQLDRELAASSHKPADLIYGIDEPPPIGVSMVLAVQHVFIAVMSLAYPVLVTLEASGTNLDAASVVSMSLIAMAAATALQVRRMGPLGSGFLAPHITSAIYLGPSLLAARVGGLGLVFGMTLIAGAFSLILGPLLRRFRKLFPPEVSGVVVLMVGISMVPVGLTRLIGLGNGDSQASVAEFAVGLVTLGTIIVLTIAPLGRIRLYSTAIGIGCGYAAALMLGILDVQTFEPLAGLPLLGLHALPDVSPSFSALLTLPFLAAALASGVKNAGLITSCQKMNDSGWKRPDTRSVSGGLSAAGTGNLVSGLLGGVGLDISAGSIGLARATGATARVLGYFVAALLLALALMPKLTAAIALMPSPVMGAGLVYVACHLITSGTELIASRMLDARRTYIIGLSLVAGTGSLAIPELLHGSPEWLLAMFGNPLALSTTVAVVLNYFMTLGVSSRAQIRTRLDDGLRDAVTRFVEQQGATWGARSDVVRRAAPAIVEWCEDVALEGFFEEAEIALEFDEFRLIATVMPIATSGAPAADPESARSAAGRLARRYDCTVQALDRAGHQLVFEH